MPSPEPTTAAASPAGPRYPQVRVRLSGADGNAHILIGKVAVALRRQVGDDAANGSTPPPTNAAPTRNCCTSSSGPCGSADHRPCPPRRRPSVQPQRHHPSPGLMPPCTSGAPYARSAKEEPMPHTTAHHPDPPHHTPGPDRDCDTWRRALDALREAGAQAGRDAADWWEQDTLGGRASGHTTARAVAILAGLEDIDPAIVDALPVSPRTLDEDVQARFRRWR
jgi:hypothetical protein